MYDAVVIGAGHNGLVCGAYLARAGLKVIALERRQVIGGAAVTEELWPGFKVSVASYVMGLLQPKVILDLDLRRHGFEVLKPPPLFQPLSDGRYVVFWDDPEKFRTELEKLSPRDAAAYPEYVAHLREVAPIMRRLLWEIPPDPGSKSPRDVLDLVKFVWRFRDVGGRFYDVYDLLTLSAYDYLSRWFENEHVKLALGFYAGGGGGNASIKSPGSAYMLARSVVRDNTTAAGGWGFVRGGMGGISEAIAKAGMEAGLQVRTGAEVTSILVKDGRARGVALSSGQEIQAKTVIANASARTTFLRLVAPKELPGEFVNQIANFRTASTAFKINLAVEELPTYPAFQPTQVGFDYPVQFRIAPSLDYMERAHDESRYGQFSHRPFLTVMAPSVVDETLAPKGKHVLNIFGGHAPYRLRDGNWDNQREALFGTVLDTLSEHAPGFGNCILHRQVLTPLDLERVFDLPGGHVHHGEISTDQIFFRRPAPHYADYRSPIGGLYQCGASTHPGGGVTGVPGHNAARVILSDRRRWR